MGELLVLRRKVVMVMGFPPAGAEIYYNEYGECVGWDMPASPEDFYCDICGYPHYGDCPDDN